MHTRDYTHGAGVGVGSGGGDVALMVNLLSAYPTLPASASLSLYRYGNEVRVWGY